MWVLAAARFRWALLLLLLFAAPAAAQPSLWLKPTAVAQTQWRGMLPTEGSGVASGVLIGPYPVFGVVGLLAAIATHAAISQSVQTSQRQREQEEADKVLDSYRAALQAWPSSALWAAAAEQAPAPSSLKLWSDGAAAAAHEPTVEAQPVFTMAQDEAVLIVDVAVKLVPAAGAPQQSSVVRVVSSPHDAADARVFWSADEARRLKATAAAMLAHAVQLAQQHPLPAAATSAGREAAAVAARPQGRPQDRPQDHSQDQPPEPPMRTYRYLQGSLERSERAQMLAGDCTRAVLRTLRAGLLSVPLRPAPDGSCTRSAAF